MAAVWRFVVLGLIAVMIAGCATGPMYSSAQTEVERSLSFSLAPGEKKYVKASISFGLVVGRINFGLVNEAAGEAALEGLAYSPEL